ITYEQNSFINLQKKTLLGMRADYGDLEDPIKLGATMMRLSQKSPIDKFRLGEEPISNMIWGVDGRIELEPRWLTRAVDFLPLVQTREPSSIQITGEFAQLRPSHVTTNAFEKSRRKLQDRDMDFRSDELRGLSYIDDFEGFENTYSLKQPGAWVLSAAPDSIGAVDPLPGDPFLHTGSLYDSLRTNYRASLGWYTLNEQLFRELDQVLYGKNRRSIEPVEIRDVFPNRDVSSQTERTLATMDIHFSPQERGPYNYTTDLPGFFQNPKAAWGGMTQRIPEGYTDFTLKNIEFVEFVFRPFAENDLEDAGLDAKLYVDLGSISEDVVPNQRLNTEDGLSTTSASQNDLDEWSRLTLGTQNQAIDINDDTRQTEDLGLDGLVSSYTGTYNPLATEANLFQNFLNALDENAINDPLYAAEVIKAREDPSGDDYKYFNGNYFSRSDIYPLGAKVQQRFSRFFPGTELNSYEAQREFGTDASNRGNARYPDTEDLNINSTVDTDNSYFQYEVPLSLSELNRLAAQPGVGVGDYVVTEIVSQEGVGTGWYQVRIPVRDFTRRVGTIADFSKIESMRIWTTGHEVPITVRFASLELVGSQWQKSTRVAEDTTGGAVYAPEALLTISSINNEENANEYLIPNGTVVSEIRLPTGETDDAREQSMVLRVQDLGPGQQRAIFKTFQELDLLKYENVRMFVHMHGRTADGVDLTTLDPEAARSKATLFIRIGANETNDYYEYEQPLSPSQPSAASADALWQTRVEWNGQVIDLNSVNIRLGALNQLKFARDSQVFPVDKVFWNVVDGPEGPIRQGPDVSGFTPPGTRIGVKGNPSLAKVNTIVIGIRNPADPLVGAGLNKILEDVSVWVNELRVSGYDETNGWAGVMNADIKLADLARIRANITRQTDGFGSLSSTLGEREQTNVQNWGVTSELNVDKFIPERYGWSLPVNVQYQSNVSTPRFSPQRGDVRVDEIIAQIEESPDLSDAEKEQQKAAVIDDAQTASVTRSITTRVGKSGSRGKLLRNTLDNLSLSYSYSDAEASTPQLRLNDSWRWSSAVNYSFRMGARTVRPFWFIAGIPVIGFLGDINFNYAPNNVTLGGTLNRNFTATQERLRLQPGETLDVPEIVEFPLREGHTFAHRRNFDFGYNPFTFLNLTFSTNTNQSLNAIGVDTLSSMLILTDSLTNQYQTFPGLDVESALAQGLIDSTMIERTAFQVDRLYVAPTDRVVSRIFSGMSPRTEQYQQRFQATFQPKFNRYEWLTWLNISPVSYSATYSWSNGPVGRVTGANVSTQVDLRGGLTLRPQEFWRNFGFYETLEEQQRTATNERRRKLQARETEREQRKEARALQKERDREIRRLNAIAEEDTTKADSVAAVIAALPPLRLPTATPAAAAAAAPDSTVEESSLLEKLLPDPRPLLRQFVLAVTGIRDLSITYQNTRRGSSSNVGDMGGNTYYTLYDAFRGLGPSIGY
ncbi:MAG TPA: cell surface protein SprA, partial [Rhodothermales bacterium]